MIQIFYPHYFCLSKLKGKHLDEWEMGRTFWIFYCIPSSNQKQIAYHKISNRSDCYLCGYVASTHSFMCMMVYTSINKRRHSTDAVFIVCALWSVNSRHKILIDSHTISLLIVLIMKLYAYECKIERETDWEKDVNGADVGSVAVLSHFSKNTSLVIQ